MGHDIWIEKDGIPNQVKLWISYNWYKYATFWSVEYELHGKTGKQVEEMGNLVLKELEQRGYQKVDQSKINIYGDIGNEKNRIGHFMSILEIIISHAKDFPTHYFFSDYFDKEINNYRKEIRVFPSFNS